MDLWGTYDHSGYSTKTTSLIFADKKNVKAMLFPGFM